MDTLSLVVLMLISFLALSQGITWLFAVIMGVMLILSGSWPLRIVILIGTVGIYIFESELKPYWFVFFAVLAGLIILIGERKPSTGGGGEEQYSPELMRLLGGG
ncbi:hypothetical protein H0N95_02640 [Candidatus Micrarchaeota archaeon]|nr:hypothetical protein [Candidatus Micrarchaeota archaeon]